MSLQRTQTPFVAGEGVPFLLGLAAVTAATWHFLGLYAALLPAALFAYLFLIFRDPNRPVPAVPLGVVSPVDGTVLEVGPTDDPVLGGEAQSISIRVDSLGAYTARCPAEGKIMDLATDGQRNGAAVGGGCLWLRTDEGDDVILRFRGNRLGLAPRAFLRFGERVGQGQRCAYLRLTRIAEVQVPPTARLQVEAGQSVSAGSDLLAKLPHH